MLTLCRAVCGAGSAMTHIERMRLQAALQALSGGAQDICSSADAAADLAVCSFRGSPGHRMKGGCVELG